MKIIKAFRITNINYLFLYLLIALPQISLCQVDVSGFTYASFNSLGTSGTFGPAPQQLTISMTSSVSDGGFELDQKKIWNNNGPMDTSGFTNSAFFKDVIALKETHPDNYSTKTITFSAELFLNSMLMVEDLDATEDWIITFKNSVGGIIDPTANITQYLPSGIPYNGGVAPTIQTTSTYIQLTGKGAIYPNPVIIFKINTATVRSIEIQAKSMNTGNAGFYFSHAKTSALPIDLLNFDVSSVENNYVNLYWRTASEINNDFFNIERSINGVDWEIVKDIDGAGNSSSMLNYSTKDYNPYSGISYYRLKQTDFDGQFSYSKIRSVNSGKIEDSKIEIYPIPANDKVTIAGSKNEIEQITIYSVLGQDVTSLTQQIENNKTKLVIDLSKLTSGIYYLKTRTTTNKVYKQ